MVSKVIHELNHSIYRLKIFIETGTMSLTVNGCKEVLKVSECKSQYRKS